MTWIIMPLSEYYSAMRLFRTVRKKIHTLLQNSSRTWFVTEYAIAGERHESPVEASEFPGLIFHYQLDPDISGIRLISYWESREDFEASRFPLEQRLGTATLQRAAWVRRITVERKPFWKRFTLYGLLVHAVAVLGALVALQEYGAWLFEEPRIALDLDSPEPINLSEGAPFQAQLILTNQRSSVTTKVSDLKAYLKGMKPDLLSFSSRDLGKEGSIKLPIRARASKPGVYRLEVQGRGRSGWMAGWKSLAFERDVRVWSRSPQIKFSLAPDSPSRAELKGRLLVGEDAPLGLDCFVNLMKEPSLHFGPLEFKGVMDWPDPTASRDGTISNQRWTTSSLRAFSETSFSLFIEGQPTNTWEKVSQEITTECYNSTEQTKHEAH